MDTNKYSAVDEMMSKVQKSLNEIYRSMHGQKPLNAQPTLAETRKHIVLQRRGTKPVARMRTKTASTLRKSAS